jgi:integrase
MSNLSRARLRKLGVGESVSSRGVTYTRLANGDGRWSVNVMVRRVRHHIVVGLESEGYTLTQCTDVIAGLKAKKRELEHGVVAPKHRTRHSIKQAAKSYLTFLEEHGGKDIEGKRGRFDRHICRLLGDIAVHRLTEQDWARYVAQRSNEGATSATINREQAALLHMLRTMVKQKELAAVPCLLAKGREAPARLVYLTPEQTKTLLEAASNDSSPHALTFAMIAVYTGMRASPILNLRARDIDCDSRVIWVVADKAGQREQPMPQTLADYLRPLVEMKKADDFVFASKRAKDGRLYQINGIFARCVKRAKLPSNVTAHVLRHTMATNAAHAGLDAATIQGLGGWKTRAMAERYTHAANLASAMDTFEAHMIGRRVTPKLQRRSRKHA